MQPPSPPPPPFPPNLTAAPSSSSSSSSSASDCSTCAYKRLRGDPSACAACRHQRRRCPTDCILRPYFPAADHQTFERANRLFGVHNIVKILRKAAPELRHDAAKSIIFESNARANYPVSGCLPYLLELQRRIKIAEAELQAVRGCIEIVRSSINDR